MELIDIHQDPDEVFELLESIGRGAFSFVHKAKLKSNGKIVAVKVISLETVQDDWKSLIREVNILQEFDHPNIVKCFGCCKDDDNIYIIMELCSGGALDEIYEAIKSGYSENEVKVVIKELLNALSVVHEHGIVHRDIKGGNIMLNDTGVLKLVDFGTAIKLERGKRANSFIGTPYWMAPEVIDNKSFLSPYDQSADIWSVGITAIELVEAGPPLGHVNPMRAILMIPGQPPPTLTEPENWSKQFADFLTQCLSLEPETRKSAIELLKHPWFENTPDISLLKGLCIQNTPTAEATDEYLTRVLGEPPKETKVVTAEPIKQEEEPTKEEPRSGPVLLASTELTGIAEYGTPAPDLPPSIIHHLEDTNTIPAIEILHMEPGSEPIINKKPSNSVSNTDAQPKMQKPHLSNPGALTFDEALTRKPSQNAIRAQTIRDASAVGFKSIQVEDQQLVQKQLNAIRLMQKQQLSQTEHMNKSFAKEADRLKSKLEKLRKEFTQQEPLEVPVKKQFKLKSEALEKKQNQERKLLEKKQEDSMRDLIKSQKEKRANLTKVFRESQKSAVGLHKQKTSEMKDNLSKFEYQEMKKGTIMSNIVNQQLREEAEHMQKVRLEEILEVHKLQEQQLEEYSALLLTTEAETSELKMEVVEAVFKSNKETMAKKFELEMNEWKMQYELEQMQMNLLHELQQIHQVQQLKLQNEQALQTFKSDFKTQEANHHQNKKKELEQALKDAEKKWKGASKSEMKKIYAQVKEQAIQDGLNKDKEFAELQEQRQKDHIENLELAQKSQQARLKYKHTKEKEQLKEKFALQKAEMDARHDKEKRDIQSRLIQEERRLEQEQQYNVITLKYQLDTDKLHQKHRQIEEVEELQLRHQEDNQRLRLDTYQQQKLGEAEIDAIMNPIIHSHEQKLQLLKAQHAKELLTLEQQHSQQKARMQRRTMTFSRVRAQSADVRTFIPTGETVLSASQNRRNSIFVLKPTGERPPRALWAEVGRHRLANEEAEDDLSSDNRTALFADIINKTARLKPTKTNTSWASRHDALLKDIRKEGTLRRKTAAVDKLPSLSAEPVLTNTPVKAAPVTPKSATLRNRPTKEKSSPITAVFKTMRKGKDKDKEKEKEELSAEERRRSQTLY